MKYIKMYLANETGIGLRIIIKSLFFLISVLLQTTVAWLSKETPSFLLYFVHTQWIVFQTFLRFLSELSQIALVLQTNLYTTRKKKPSNSICTCIRFLFPRITQMICTTLFWRRHFPLYAYVMINTCNKIW